MKYLVVGSGGREHAIAWRLTHDGSASEVYVAPGNGGIEDRFRVPVQAGDFEGIAACCEAKKIDMVVVGPEAPLADGLVNFLEAKRIPVFGPSRAASRLEGSKLFAKAIMEKYGIPTAGHRDFTGREDLAAYIKTVKEFPLVIKLDGLAAGKGVSIPESRDEALAFIGENVSDDTRVFVEDFLEGEEASILGISDGTNVVPLIAAQDHKRVFDGDKGPNTGGMGAYAPAPVATPERVKAVYERVLMPAVAGMREEGIPFKGVLYAGVIIRGESIRVLEFNARFGDPETQVILPLLKGKLGDLFWGSVNGELRSVRAEFLPRHAISVVMASQGYPGPYPKGREITGLGGGSQDVTVFHAGTTRENGRILTSGGRVLNVTALGDSLSQARDRAYAEIGKISFEGAFYRTDIGHRALK